MSTLEYNAAPTSRIHAGDVVLTAAKTIATRPIAKRFGAFASTHRSYAAAQKNVDGAETKLRAAQARLAECDVEQDEAISALATVLAGLGLRRANPFGPLGFEAPSVMARRGYGDEAKRLLALVLAIGKRKDLAKAAAACKRGKAAALAVQKALAAVAPCKRACDEARTRRDALAQPWETAFSALKRAARFADDDGRTALFATLFERTAAPKTKPRAKKNARANGKPPADGATGTEG